jgi:hypothetical protein
MQKMSAMKFHGTVPDNDKSWSNPAAAQRTTIPSMAQNARAVASTGISIGRKIGQRNWQVRPRRSYRTEAARARKPPMGAQIELQVLKAI